MKNIAFALFLLTSAAVSLTSCKDSDKNPAPSFASIGLVKSSVDPDFDSLNTNRTAYSTVRLATLANPTRPTFKFTVDLYDQRDVTITKVFVYKSLRRGTNPTTYTYYPRVLQQEVTVFPSVLSYDTQELLAGMARNFTPAGGVPTLINFLGATPAASNLVFTNDAIVFTFEYEAQTANGLQRIILTPTRKVAIKAPTEQEVEIVTGAQINPPYAVIAPISNQAR